uniref:Protoheme IX farnesyltransferase n=1 Tax=Lygus hesperus TaxID=30085 RepID=A0A0A9WK34_LYGHE
MVPVLTLVFIVKIRANELESAVSFGLSRDVAIMQKVDEFVSTTCIIILLYSQMYFLIIGTLAESPKTDDQKVLGGGAGRIDEARIERRHSLSSQKPHKKRE